MPLDYSQKRLFSLASHAKNRRLRYLALTTGILSVILSLINLVLMAR